MSAATAAMQTGKAATKSAVVELVTILAAWNTTDSIKVAATAIAPPMAACLATDLAACLAYSFLVAGSYTRQCPQ